MKKLIKFHFYGGLLLFLFIPAIAYSQAGLTNPGTTQEQERNQAGNGFDYGNKSGSALQQLENITGRKINTSGTQQNDGANPASYKTKNVSSNTLLQDNIKMQLASGIASAFFSLIFSDNPQNDRKAIEQQRQQAALLAQRAAEEKRYDDSMAQAKYEKMMQSYKLLNDPNAVHFKTLSTSQAQFKSLDDQNAPMTMEEQERQNLIKKGIGVTWDYNTWAQISGDVNKIEDLPVTPQENAADQYLDAAINKIETFEGGKVAALAGRFMVNIKNETMSYLKDASDAAVSGDVSKMEETGQLDLRKLTSNAIYNTAQETIKSYTNQGKDFITGQLKENNFAIMLSGGQALLQNYNIYAHVSDDWKVSLKKY